MCEAAGLPQRRACRLAGLSLSTCRYSAQRPAADAQLSLRITELALERRRFGYRRIWQLLRRGAFTSITSGYTASIISTACV